MRITEHFDSNEFKCKCGCGREDISKELVERLEHLFAAIGADKIIVSSGIRCSSYSMKVGGSATDMHTKSGAADIIVYKNGKALSSYAVAAIAEDLGLFNGIGIINDTYVHLDIRGIIPYSNSHWFGNEVNGTNIATFKSYLPNWYKDEVEVKPLEHLKSESTIKPHRIEVILDGETIIKKDLD